MLYRAPSLKIPWTSVYCTWKYDDVHKYGVLAPQFPIVFRIQLWKLEKESLEGYVEYSYVEIHGTYKVYMDIHENFTLVCGRTWKFWCTWKSMDFHLNPPWISMYIHVHCKIFAYTYMRTLPDHPGASWKCSATPTLPGVRQNLPDVKIQKKKKNFFFFFFFLNNFPDHHFCAYVW